MSVGVDCSGELNPIVSPTVSSRVGQLGPSRLDPVQPVPRGDVWLLGRQLHVHQLPAVDRELCGELGVCDVLEFTHRGALLICGSDQPPARRVVVVPGLWQLR